ncbi:MAG: DUF1080 domain-containing protein, partial [Aureliella sp.]
MFYVAVAWIFCATMLSASAQSASSDSELKPLFNGTDLSGWYGWSTRDPQELWAMSADQQAEYKRKSVEGGLLNSNGQPDNEQISAHWRVENGELVNDGHGLYLTTDKDYGDFQLQLEYKALPLGDSGVYLRGTPQVQIWDPDAPDPNGLGNASGSGALWNNHTGS